MSRRNVIVQPASTQKDVFVNAKSAPIQVTEKDLNVIVQVTGNPGPAAQPPTESAVSRYVPLFIFWGESNSGGYGENSLATSTEQGPRANFQILHSIDLNRFEPSDMGTNNNIDHAGLQPTSHGWEVGLANSFDAGAWWSSTGFLVQTGQGASKVADWGVAGSYWSKFLARTRAARSILKAQGLVPCTYVFATIGINDAIAGTAEATWETELKALNTRIRQELGPVPIISPTFMSISPGNNYNDTLLSIGDSDKLMVVVDSTGIPTRDQNHWNYAGMKTLADKMAAAARDWGQAEGYYARQIAAVAGVDWVYNVGQAPVLPSIVCTPTSVSFTEGSAGQAFNVKLSSAPAGTISVSVAIAGGNAQVSLSALTFNTGNWGTNQPVTVTSPNDGAASGNRSATVTLSSPGNVAAQTTVAVTIVDAGVVAGAPTNTALPAITGTAALDQTLTCSQGTWTGSPTAYAYQWLRNGTNISGETASTHIVVAADQGTALSCKVTATNATGSTPATSATVNVPGSGGGGLSDFTWKDLSNMTVDGNGFLVTGTGTGGANTNETFDNAAAWEIVAYWESAAACNAIVTMVDDAPSTDWSWSASQVFVCGIYQSSGKPYWGPSGSVANEIVGWTLQYPCYVKMKKAGNDIAVESSQDGIAWTARHTVTGVLSGKTTLYPRVLNALSAAGKKIKVQRVSPNVPACTVNPVVSGTAAVGQLLTTTDGTWTNTPTGYTYQWLRSGVSISGATAKTYTIVAGDAGAQIACKVTAANANGAGTATSNTILIPGGMALNPVTWADFQNTNSPTAGEIRTTAATLPAGAKAVETIDATQPFEIEVEMATSAASNTQVLGLHQTNDTNFGWTTGNIFQCTIYQYNGGLHAATHSTDNAHSNIKTGIASWPIKVKLKKSGDDVLYYLAEGAGASYEASPFYTFVGALTGKTTLYLKHLGAVAANGSGYIARRAVGTTEFDVGTTKPGPEDES